MSDATLRLPSLHDLRLLLLHDLRLLLLHVLRLLLLHVLRLRLFLYELPCPYPLLFLRLPVHVRMPLSSWLLRPVRTEERQRVKFIPLSIMRFHPVALKATSRPERYRLVHGGGGAR